MSAAIKKLPQSPTGVRMTVDEFEQLDDSDQRIELIDGEVVWRGEMKPPHALATELARQAIQPLLPVGRFIREDKPVRIPDFNEPFPDLTVAHGNPRTYANRHPGPQDVSLLVEISDTTLQKDRGIKKENYARSGIPVYWIVDLNDGQIEAFSDPTPDGYKKRTLFSRHLGGCEVPLIIDGNEVGRILLTDLLP